MATRKSTSGSQGQQPEALKTFHTAARSGSVKPKDQGLTAKPDTSPKPKDLKQERRGRSAQSRSGGTAPHQRGS
jgi:hypothetical protein